MEKIKDWDGGYTLKYLLDYPSNSKIRQIILEELRGLIEKNREFLPEVEEEFLLKFLFQVNTIRNLLKEVREDVKSELVEKVKSYLTTFFQQANQLGGEYFMKEWLSLRDFVRWVYILKEEPEYLCRFIENLLPAAGKFPRVNVSIGWLFLLEGAKSLVEKLVEHGIEIDGLFVNIRPDEMGVAPQLKALDNIGLPKEVYKRKFSILLGKVKKLPDDIQNKVIAEGIENLTGDGPPLDFLEAKFMELFRE